METSQIIILLIIIIVIVIIIAGVAYYFLSGSKPTPPPPPSRDCPTPTNLSGKLENKVVNLIWNKIDLAKSYKIYIQDNTGKVDTKTSNTNSFSFSAEECESYNISVSSICEKGESLKSNPFNISANKPLTPTNLAYTRSGNVLHLTWNPIGSRNYVLYIKDDTGKVVERRVSGEKLDYPIENCKYYNFSIASIVDSCLSDKSREVIFTSKISPPQNIIGAMTPQGFSIIWDPLSGYCYQVGFSDDKLRPGKVFYVPDNCGQDGQIIINPLPYPGKTNYYSMRSFLGNCISDWSEPKHFP